MSGRIYIGTLLVRAEQNSSYSLACLLTVLLPLGDACDLHTHFGVLLWRGVMMLDDADIAVTARQDRAPGQGEFPSVLLDYDDVTADDEDVDCGGFSEHDSFQQGRWK